MQDTLPISDGAKRSAEFRDSPADLANLPDADLQERVREWVRKCIPSGASKSTDAEIDLSLASLRGDHRPALMRFLETEAGVVIGLVPPQTYSVEEIVNRVRAALEQQ